MKINNILLIIFTIIVISIIVTAGLFIKENNNKKLENESSANKTMDQVSIVGNIKMALSGYDTMNPILTKNKEIINISKLIFEPLIDVKSDFKLEYCLAKSVSTLSDKEYLIEINNDIKWQDGSNLSSQDIDFTIKKISENSGSTYFRNITDIDTIEIVNETELKIKLNKPVKYFEYNLTFPILSSKFYLREDFNSNNKIPIGTGMYRIASIDDNSIFLTQNERWHKKSSNIKTESISIKKYNSIGEAFNDFKMGNIDILNTHVTNYTEFVGLMGYNKKEYSDRQYDFIAFNTKSNIFSDINMRKAISYAINKEKIINESISDKKNTRGILDYGHYLFSDQSLIRFDEGKAREYLEKSGWTYINGKYSKKENNKTKNLEFDLLLSNAYPERVKFAEEMKKDLKAIGINVNLQILNNEEYLKKLSDRSYDMVLTGIVNSINPNLDYFFGDNNIAKYDNDEIKSKLYNLENFQEIQRISNEEAVYIPLYRNKGIMLLNANVGGEFEPNGFSIYNNFEKWYRQR